MKRFGQAPTSWAAYALTALLVVAATVLSVAGVAEPAWLTTLLPIAVGGALLGTSAGGVTSTSVTSGTATPTATVRSNAG